MPYGFICLDCGCDTYNWEYYSVHKELWRLAFKKELEKGIDRTCGMLCIGCLEKRIGKKLTKEDFRDCPLNRGEDWHTKSSRLQDRLGLEVKPDWENRKRREYFQKYLKGIRVARERINEGG